MAGGKTRRDQTVRRAVWDALEALIGSTGRDALKSAILKICRQPGRVFQGAAGSQEEIWPLKGCARARH